MATKKKKKTLLDFKMQAQLQPAWCWTAVGTSCALFYDPDSGWTQCKVASKSIVPSPGNCCANPSGLQCDVPGPLLNDNNQGSLATTHIPSRFEEGAIPVRRLIAELDQGRIVAYRLQITLQNEIDLTVGGNEVKMAQFFHFVVIAGYEFSGSADDKNVTVYVYDPFSLETGYSTMSYDVFQTAYKCHGGAVPDPTHEGAPDNETGCTITHSYFTSPIQSA